MVESLPSFAIVSKIKCFISNRIVMVGLVELLCHSISSIEIVVSILDQSHMCCFFYYFSTGTSLVNRSMRRIRHVAKASVEVYQMIPIIPKSKYYQSPNGTGGFRCTAS